MKLRIEYFSYPSPDFGSLVTLLDAEIQAKNGEIQKVYDGFNKLDGIHDFFIVYAENMPVGIGALKYYDESTYEIKRVFVKKEYRGQGISKFLMKALETKAGEYNIKYLVLETTRHFVEAVNFYRSQGYQIIENYGQYVGMEMSLCMRKELY
jgi:putative acetyltransferase